MDNKIIPLFKPQKAEAAARDVARSAGISDAVALLGIRGYFLNTMGEPGKNDRGIYDDAILLLAPECYIAFNANCDPSLFREGIANLKTGVWKYKIGIHGLSRPLDKQYKALVQAAPVTVVRDGEGEDTGMFGINIHKGAANSTSSLGCQTIVPQQWESFITSVETQMKKHGQKVIPYLLTET